MAAKNKSNELKISRIYDAPVKAVWDAWTDPVQTAKWWGPRGFTITTHSKDLRTGGTWHYTMHGPDGVDYPNLTKYLEVIDQSRLVYDHGGTIDRPPMFRVTVNFMPERGKTRMDMTMTLPTPEAAEQTKKFVKQAGGNATWDRLAEYLDQSSTGEANFVIHRTFEAPVDQVFAMWTDPEHLARWLPPAGFAMTWNRSEIATGKVASFVMAGATGEMRGLFHYLEITPPERIVYTQQFCDAEERVIRPQFAPIWPETMRVIVTFNTEAADETRVQVKTEIAGSASPEERATFAAARDGMSLGWTGSFDSLETLLTE